MTESSGLELLAREIDWPEAPDVAARLELAPRRTPRRLAVAVALAALAVAVAFAVPPARSAILRFLHLGGVTIERVETLPAAEQRSLGAELGVAVSPDDAEFVLGRPFALPPEARGAQLYERSGAVSALLSTRDGPVLLSEFSSFSGFIKKMASASSRFEFVQIAPGIEGLWLFGARHVILQPQAPPRLAGNVLLWEREQVTFRLEGARLTKQEALRLAHAIVGTATG